MKRIAILGATSTIAQHCARLWVAQPCEILLVARDASRLEAFAQDLRVRGPQVTVRCVLADLSDPQAIERCTADVHDGRPIDLVLIAQGTLPDQDRSQDEPALRLASLQINGVSPALCAEAFAARMAVAGRGTIAIIGSVAGDRGRRSNYIYGAAKGLVTRYAQGLQHRFAGTAVRVVLIKPGPTDTPMTQHLQGAGGRMATPEAVARCIVDGVERGASTIYAPAKWRLIMMVVRHIPALVFRHLNI